MPELPEIVQLSQQVKTHLVGKTISSIEILQPKCLNIPAPEFTAALTGATLLDACNRGKWVLIETDRGWLMISLGMGGEMLLTQRDQLPEKRRLIFDFSDGTCLVVNFWWFGYAHYALSPEQHDMVAKLGPNALDISVNQLKELFNGKRGAIKAFLLDQSRIAGIGNSYVHDILFLSGLHPLRKVESLADLEIQALWQAIQTVLVNSLQKGGAAYEMDLFGHKGGFTFDDILIGYREGQPCPKCGALIQKLKTGSTTGFICPTCQPIK